MPHSDFTYRACSCRAQRTFRLLRPLPVVAEFYAIRYSVDLFAPMHVGGSERLVACLPWQDLIYARELDHAGHGVLRKKLATAYDLDCGTLAEVLFLRMVQQRDAEQLAGPHSKVPEGFYSDYQRAQRASECDRQRRLLATLPSRLRL
jgi:hypothetical protein